MSDDTSVGQSARHVISISIKSETLEQIPYLARRSGLSVEEMAAQLLATQAEAEAGLSRGTFLRRYMYR
jgi:hypothetical protein